ncbi:uncharacterized protein LOC131018233 [Salvia miltiorrhiza]|uniref:uncharacterized protein LOC131018233 n=1 Tax=Salvia miltiorrhiza TaxID=226208 RepID=UPI0025ABC47B|nr:uncharacterized protein LOC131018233 [Salvia miltiorrhiza]
MGSRVRKLGFGWVESSGEYKVFVVVETNRKLVGKVYSSKTKSWKTIEICDYLYACRPRGLFAGGKLYWYNGCIIIFLDLKSEVFGRIEIPYKDIGFKMDYFVGVLGGCLCVLYYNPSFPDRRGLRVSRVCVMKEAWEEVVTLCHLNELLQPPLVSLNGQILVDCGSTLLVYSARDNVFRFTKVSSGLRSYVYVESLLSPEDV